MNPEYIKVLERLLKTIEDNPGAFDTHKEYNFKAAQLFPRILEDFKKLQKDKEELIEALQFIADGYHVNLDATVSHAAKALRKVKERVKE